MSFNPTQGSSYGYYNPYYNPYLPSVPFYPSESNGDPYNPYAPFYPDQGNGDPYNPYAPFYPDQWNGDPYNPYAPFYPDQGNGDPYNPYAPFYPDQWNGYPSYNPTLDTSEASPALPSRNLFTAEEINALSERVLTHTDTDDANSFPFLSDHPITTYKIKLIDKLDIEDTLVVIVWNKLSKGDYVANDHERWNNLWGEESLESYKARLQQQYTKILNIISSQAKPSIFLLQESRDLCSKSYQQLSEKFISQLNEKNWECFKPANDLNNVILYDRSQLKLEGKIKTSRFKIQKIQGTDYPRRRVLCGLFTHIPTQLKIEIASFHLNPEYYWRNPSAKNTFNFFEECLKKGSFSLSPQNSILIAGGDTNIAASLLKRQWPEYCVHTQFKTDSGDVWPLKKANLRRRVQALFTLTRDGTLLEVQEGPTTSFHFIDNRLTQTLVLPNNFLDSWVPPIKRDQLKLPTGKKKASPTSAPLPTIEELLATPNYSSLSRFIVQKMIEKLRDNPSDYLDLYIGKEASIRNLKNLNKMNFLLYKIKGQEALYIKFLEKIKSIPNLATLEIAELPKKPPKYTDVTALFVSAEDFSKICQEFDIPTQIIKAIIPFLPK